MNWLIVAGSYERLLYGIKFCGLDKSVESEFIYPSHISCIKAIAAGGRFLASGATDEHLKVYDIKLRKEVGTLMQHEGSITCLEFYSKTHLVSSSEDGSLCLYRVKDWEVLKTLRGHKGQVNHFCIHPSGKIMLSVGKDSTLRLWDLMRGLCVKTIKLKHAAEKVIFNSDGSRYAVCTEKVITITDIDTGNDICIWESEQRIHAIHFISVKNAQCEQVEVLLATGEDKLVHVLSSTENKYIKSLDIAAKTRIKDCAIAVDGEIRYLVTCTSDGIINIANVDNILTDDSEKMNLASIAEYNTGCRLVCLEIVNLTTMGQVKKLVRPKIVEVQSEVESEYEMPKHEKITVTFEGEAVQEESKKARKKRKFNKAKK